MRKALICTAAALMLWPPAALANIDTLGIDVTPSSTAAGVHAEVTVTESFAYSNGSDSVKDTTIHFPPGLLGNPQAAPKCTEADFEADNCAAGTQVGEVTVSASIGGLPPIPSPGSIYNLVPDASHPAVLGIVVTPTGASPIHLHSPITLRTSTDFGIESPVKDQPNSVLLAGVFPTPIQITQIALKLYGDLPGGTGSFMTNPTSCKPATTNFDAVSHEAPDTATASDTFTPTDCDKLPFSPRVVAKMGAAGSTAKGSRVPFQATITQAVGESSQLSASVTLPASLSSGTNAVSVLCTAAQLAVAACPDAARIGTATISSPLLPTPVQGPVFALLRPAQLPGVGVEFGGTLPFVLGGSAALGPGGRLQNVFAGLPDVPLTSFALAIAGGAHGLLVANRNICTGPAPTVDGAFTAQSGAAANATAPVTVQGCGPGAAKRPRGKASARGLAGSKPRLQVTVLKGASPLRSVAVTLPKDIRVGNPRKGVAAKGASFKLSKRSVRLSRRGKLTLKLPTRGASRVTATLRGGSIHSSRRLKNRLKRHSRVKLTLVVRTVDKQGHRNTLRVRFNGRR